MPYTRRHQDPSGDEAQQRWVTVSYAAWYASLSTKTIYARIRQKRLPAQRIDGGGYRIWLPDLDDAIVRGLLTFVSAVLVCAVCHWRHRLGITRLAV